MVLERRRYYKQEGDGDVNNHWDGLEHHRETATPPSRFHLNNQAMSMVGLKFIDWALKEDEARDCVYKIVESENGLEVGHPDFHPWSNF